MYVKVPLINNTRQRKTNLAKYKSAAMHTTSTEHNNMNWLCMSQLAGVKYATTTFTTNSICINEISVIKCPQSHTFISCPQFDSIQLLNHFLAVNIANFKIYPKSQQRMDDENNTANNNCNKATPLTQILAVSL